MKSEPQPGQLSACRSPPRKRAYMRTRGSPAPTPASGEGYLGRVSRARAWTRLSPPPEQCAMAFSSFREVVTLVRSVHLFFKCSLEVPRPFSTGLAVFRVLSADRADDVASRRSELSSGSTSRSSRGIDVYPKRQHRRSTSHGRVGAVMSSDGRSTVRRIPTKHLRASRTPSTPPRSFAPSNSSQQDSELPWSPPHDSRTLQVCGTSVDMPPQRSVILM